MKPVIAPEDLERYRLTFRRRQAEREVWQRSRQQQGQQIARQAAQLLKQSFGAQRVWLFGSMLTPERIRAESDIDIAVEGLADERYLEALGQLLDLSDFSVDLVQVEYARERLRSAIARKGVLL
ncbi:MAG: nucleotidyltransferase domain-containing protein [Cyanobacteria bacterium J06614_10]